MFDYQKVTLVAITQPRLTKIIPIYDSMVEPTNKTGELEVPLTPDEFIAYTARVSNPGNQNNTETAGKLIKYLINNHHWSPFEMVDLVMEIKTTRDIGRQILRHRSFSFQEFSQRYEKASETSPPREARLQDKKNRQNSIDTDDEYLQQWWLQAQNDVQNYTQKAYEFALNNGIAKEQARAILPEGLTMSTMYMKGSLRSWIHYVDLRCANGTQKEHRDIALKCREILIQNFPSLSEYFS